MRTLPKIAALMLLLTSGCQNLTYDLGAVPFPISAKPAAGEPFTITGKNVLWLHGLAGQSQPDVAALVTTAGAGGSGIADLRITQAGSFHDWLLTHLTLGLIRMKTVTISGTKVSAVPGS